MNETIEAIIINGKTYHLRIYSRCTQVGLSGSAYETGYCYASEKNDLLIKVDEPFKVTDINDLVLREWDNDGYEPPGKEVTLFALSGEQIWQMKNGY